MNELLVMVCRSHGSVMGRGMKESWYEHVIGHGLKESWISLKSWYEGVMGHCTKES